MTAINADVEITFFGGGGSPFVSGNTHFVIAKGTAHPDETVRRVFAPTLFPYHVNCTNPNCGADEGELIIP
jgi:hypothetical protein